MGIRLRVEASRPDLFLMILGVTFTKREITVISRDPKNWDCDDAVQLQRRLEYIIIYHEKSSWSIMQWPTRSG